MVGVDAKTISNFGKSFREQVFPNFTFSEENFKPPIYNIWKVQNKSNKVSHFGNTEAQWLENLLYLYTEPFDIVVDPFAGGGSSIDICKKKLRRYYLSHLHASVNGCREQSKKKKSATRKSNLIYGLPAALRKRLRRLWECLARQLAMFWRKRKTFPFRQTSPFLWSYTGFFRARYNSCTLLFRSPGSYFITGSFR